MRFKADENLPVEVAEALRQAGHNASPVLEQQCGGSADEQLAALCQRESRVLVTLDIDFADIRNYPPAGFPGLVVLHLKRAGQAVRVGCLHASDTSASSRAA